jgi:formate--tetrahydrofolate ligase
MKPIQEIAAAAGIPAGALFAYGPHVAKVSLEALPAMAARGKLILVTAVTPTRAGEGKTVVSIGLAQGLSHIGKRAVVTLRQPSLGPIFGMKGGATGGGLAQALPAEFINLHFTGDFHAVAAAHNLLAAMLDAHLHHGNALGIAIESVRWPRAMDMNDRALRRIRTGIGTTNGPQRETGFVITAASEVMAILALASSREDLRARLARIVVGATASGAPVTAGDLEAAGAMAALLDRAMDPNLAQTSSGTPALIHAGPFANIAHGTASVAAQRLGLGIADYVVNECGFAADLGAEKYLNLVMPSTGLTPSLAVLVASVRALEPREAGFANLARHIANLGKFGLPVLVALNRFPGDTDAALTEIAAFARGEGAEAEVVDCYGGGAPGAAALAERAVALCERGAVPRPLFAADAPVRDKIGTIAAAVYGAAGVQFTEAAEASLARISGMGFGRLPVCMAKTQYSFSDDPSLAGAPSGWTLTVRDLELAAGAGFVVALAGKILRMPGLGKDPQARRIDVAPGGGTVGIV